METTERITTFRSKEAPLEIVDVKELAATMASASCPECGGGVMSYPAAWKAEGPSINPIVYCEESNSSHRWFGRLNDCVFDDEEDEEESLNTRSSLRDDRLAEYRADTGGDLVWFYLIAGIIVTLVVLIFCDAGYIFSFRY